MKRILHILAANPLTLCGAVLAWHALAGGWRDVPLDQEGHDAPDWPAFAIISAGVVLHMVSAIAVAGRIGLTAIGDTREEARRRYYDVTAAVDHAAAEM